MDPDEPTRERLLSPTPLKAQEIFWSSLSPDEHTSLSFSCADKLLWLFADQILKEKELAVAYPCLDCRGGLTLFLASLCFHIQTSIPGRAFDPILVYPGTTEIRESYCALRINVGGLLEVLRKVRILAHSVGGRPRVYPWEESLYSRLRRHKIALSDEYPLHDFFPAAVLNGDSIPRILGGRHGFGRGDDSTPPLHFAVKLHHVFPKETYKAAFLMHDALTTHAERRRLSDDLGRVSANCLIHLFESPYSPNFRKLNKLGVNNWRIRPADFPADGELFLQDAEVLEMMDAKPRLHIIPFPLEDRDLQLLYENFGRLRMSAKTDSIAADTYRRIYNLYRFILTLPVPVQDYDAVAEDFGYATVRERLEDIQDEIPSLSAVVYSFFDESLQKILSMEERLREDPARSRAILTEIQHAREMHGRIGIVITNELYGAAIERFLARSLNSNPMLLESLGIQVLHMASLRTIRPEETFNSLVFPSYRGGNTLRWVMSGKGKEAVVVCTDAERRAMLRQFNEGTGGSNTWTPRRTEPLMPLDDNLEEKLANVLVEANPDLPTIPLDDERFVQGLFEYIPSSRADPASASGPVKCRKVLFSRHYAFLPEGRAVTVVSRKKTVEKEVRDLRSGDIVLFVNYAQSRSVYDLMLDEIKRAPGFEPFVGIIQQWQRQLQTWFISSGLSYTDLHHVLSQKGSEVVAATIASWIRGNTMAPLDPENLSRLIAVVGIPDPGGDVCKMVNDAAVSLRTVYRVYARAVNSFLLKTAGDDRIEVNDLLQKYNLDIGAIRDSVVKEEVIAVSPETVSILSSVAGRLYEN